MKKKKKNYTEPQFEKIGKLLSFEQIEFINRQLNFLLIFNETFFSLPVDEIKKIRLLEDFLRS